jgi:hypothetical protein
MQCHIQMHQHHEIPQSVGGGMERVDSHRELIGKGIQGFTKEGQEKFVLEEVENSDWGPSPILEKDSINDPEVYANRRLDSIGGSGDMGEDKAAGEQIKYIPVGECINGHVYRIRARNGRIGVFDKKNDNAFILSRHKFGDNFLYPEYHWDNGKPYGTVMPLEYLWELPPMESDDMLLAYLNNLTKTVKGEEYPELKDIMDKIGKEKRDD